jgi:hypothetical protein
VKSETGRGFKEARDQIEALRARWPKAFPQGAAGGVDDVAPVGEGDEDMAGQPRRELDQLLRMELLDPFKGPERDAILEILRVRLLWG